MNWISVEKELPQDKIAVLGFCHSLNDNLEWSGFVSVYFERCTGWHRCELYDDKKVLVSHWMPLPEFPKDEFIFLSGSHNITTSSNPIKDKRT